MRNITHVSSILNKHKSFDPIINDKKTKLVKSKFNYPKLLNSWYFKFFNIGILVEKFNQKPVVTKIKMRNEIKVMPVFTLLITLINDVS